MAENENNSTMGDNIQNVKFESLDYDPTDEKDIEFRNLDMVLDVKMDVSVELGRVQVPLGKLLQLNKGSVIELDKTSDAPVDILVNGHLIAKGVVVVVNDHFAAKIIEITAGKKRLTSFLES